MSTKTTFKRIALVAVAALGLGVLSVAPSSATVTGLTVTVADGTAKLAGDAVDSTTAATVNIQGILNQYDSVTVTLVEKAKPAGSTPIISLSNADSATSTMAATQIIVDTQTTVSASGALYPIAVKETATSGIVRISQRGANAIFFNQNFNVYLETPTSTRKAGTYTYTVMVKSYDSSSTVPTTVIAKDVSIVIAAAADQSKTPSAVTSFAFLASSTQSANATKTTSDAVVSVVATASSTPAAYLFVGNRNIDAGYATAEDSLTATVTGAGVVCTVALAGTSVGTCGKSIKVKATGDTQFAITPDGTAGTSSVSVASSVLGVTYTKSLNFYASTAKTVTATAFTPRLVVGTNDSAVVVTAVDANGINWSGSLYIYPVAAADALVSGAIDAAVACVASSDKTKQYCPLTTKTTGTANFKIGNKAVPADNTFTSDAVSVTVSAATAATVKLAFDKATYAPGEKAVVTVTPVDASGNLIPAVSSAALLASSSAAITANTALTIAGTTTATVLANGTSISTEAYAGTDKTAGSYSIVVFMPQASGTVTLTAKGGTALPLAGQVAVTASASVVNASVDAATDAANEATDAANAATDAALAAADAADAATAAAQDASDAVAALSATVAKLVASLKAQITSLTNLVIKIQKKVKA